MSKRNCAVYGRLNPHWDLYTLFACYAEDSARQVLVPGCRFKFSVSTSAIQFVRAVYFLDEHAHFLPMQKAAFFR